MLCSLDLAGRRPRVGWGPPLPLHPVLGVTAAPAAGWLAPIKGIPQTWLLAASNEAHRLVSTMDAHAHEDIVWLNCSHPHPPSLCVITSDRLHELKATYRTSSVPSFPAEELLTHPIGHDHTILLLASSLPRFAPLLFSLHVRLPGSPADCVGNLAHSFLSDPHPREIRRPLYAHRRTTVPSSTYRTQSTVS